MRSRVAVAADAPRTSKHKRSKPAQALLNAPKCPEFRSGAVRFEGAEFNGGSVSFRGAKFTGGLVDLSEAVITVAPVFDEGEKPGLRLP